MRFFYDTEFHEDGTTIDLLSFGMVTENESESFYAVNQDANWESVFRNDWLRKNVLDSIDHKINMNPYARVILTDEYAMAKRHIAARLVDFVESNTPHNEEAEFWAYYGDYDHVAMSQLYGSMLQLPALFPKFTMDIKQLAVMKGNPGLPKQAYDEHNALADARHNLVMFNFLMGDNGHGIIEEYV